MYNDIRLEKGLYNLSGKSFTAALEELDPSSAYAGTPLEKLDAFERQLKRFNIRINGQDCDCVEKFFSTTETAVLFPEFVTRCIRKGFNETVLRSVCAAKTVCASSQYLGCVLSDSEAYTATSQAEQLPEATVREGTAATVLSKFGRLISASYEAVRQQRLDVFGVMLRSVGVKLAVSVVKEAVDVLVDDITPITTSALTYDDLAALYGEFDCFDMTTVITSPELASKIAAMEQLKDCSANADGKLMLPFGSELIKTPAVDSDTVIGIDRDFALEFITSTDLVMETDKLIDRQLDQMTVSITCGFRRITPDAVKVLTITAANA
ncbi:phage major capsid protein [Ruminococcus sp.]